MTPRAAHADGTHQAVLASLRDLPARYEPAQAPRGERRYRLEISGCVPHVVMVHGRRCLVRPATDGRTHATLRIERAAWLDLVGGRASGLEAFLAGRLQIHGDLNEALRLETLFRPPVGSANERAPAQMRQRDTGDGVVETYEAGPAGAPVVVALHGLGASKASLVPLIAGLSRSHRVVAFDFPGFGKSGPPRSGRHDIGALASCVVAVLDAVGADRAALVGNSLGGRVGVEVGLRAPERVRALGLLCPAVAFDEYALVRPLLAAVRAERALGLPLWPVPHALVDAGLRRLFAVADRVPADNLRAARDDFLRGLRARHTRVALAAVARHIALEEPGRFWERLAGLERPSLWVFGDTDPLVAPAYADVVRARVRNATVAVWPSCGHVPQFEHPERTLAALAAHVLAQP